MSDAPSGRTDTPVTAGTGTKIVSLFQRIRRRPAADAPLQLAHRKRMAPLSLSGLRTTPPDA